MAMTQPETKALAEEVLAHTWGNGVRLDQGTTLADRDYVLRFTVEEGPADAPASVVVKRARSWGGTYDPNSEDPNNPAWGLLDEWAGLQFLTEVAGDVAPGPRFFGGDRERGLIVIEDLGAGARPDHLMLGDDASAAEEVMVEIAASLGRLHASTVGKAERFEQLRSALGRHRPSDNSAITRLAPGLNATIDLLGLPRPAGLDADLATLTGALLDPGPFLAYTHGDPCPDNWLRVDNGLRLLDFERARFRHALLDGVYGRIHFPTCWCVNRSPAHLPPRMEAAYRRELQRGCAAAADDTLFGRAVVEACAFWTLGMCEWIVERPSWYLPPAPMVHDHEWGISTMRPRALVRSDIFARTTQEFGYLESLGAVIADLAAHLRTVWPADADAMPLYPAFRPAPTSQTV